MGGRRLCDLDETTGTRRLSYPAISRWTDRIDQSRTCGDFIWNQTAALLQKILEEVLTELDFEEVSGIFSLWYYRKSQRWQRREEEQLSEYWDSGLTIQEYSELKELPYESARRWILWLYLLYDFTKSSGYFRWNCNLLTICKRLASSMVMVDRGEIFSKGEMATK